MNADEHLPAANRADAPRTPSSSCLHSQQKSIREAPVSEIANLLQKMNSSPNKMHRQQQLIRLPVCGCNKLHLPNPTLIQPTPSIQSIGIVHQTQIPTQYIHNNSENK